MSWKSLLSSKVIKYAAGVAAVASAYMAQPYRPVVFMGNSMGPTYHDKEIAVASTRIGELFRGDVVVINGPTGPIVKRIAFLPGDKIDYYFFAGEWMLGNDEAFRKLNRPDRFPHKKVTVPKGQVFVLGDNWSTSQDSRVFGTFPISSIKAKLTEPKAPVPVTMDNAS